jgi:hypothetical protein
MHFAVNGLSPVLSNIKIDTPADNAPPLSITAILADLTPSKLASDTQYKELNPFIGTLMSQGAAGMSYCAGLVSLRVLSRACADGMTAPTFVLCSMV